MSVLIVDDATDGVNALAKRRDGTFGLVIGEWNIEPLTGLQVRADARLGAARFIIVTAESKAENVIAAKHADLNHILAGLE